MIEEREMMIKAKKASMEIRRTRKEWERAVTVSKRTWAGWRKALARVERDDKYVDREGK